MDKIFTEQYVKRKDIPWAANLLDSSTTFSKDDLVTFVDEKGQRQVGRLHWIGQVPWEQNQLFGVERVSRSVAFEYFIF